MDFENLIVEPDMNLWNPEEELKAEVFVSSCPMLGDLLWSPALPVVSSVVQTLQKQIPLPAFCSPFGLHFSGITGTDPTLDGGGVTAH